jgi:hypothetical protein
MTPREVVITFVSGCLFGLALVAVGYIATKAIANVAYENARPRLD